MINFFLQIPLPYLNEIAITDIKLHTVYSKVKIINIDIVVSYLVAYTNRKK